MALKEKLEFVTHKSTYRTTHLRHLDALLGLAFEFRIHYLNRNNSTKTFFSVVDNKILHKVLVLIRLSKERAYSAVYTHIKALIMITGRSRHTVHKTIDFRSKRSRVSEYDIYTDIPYIIITNGLSNPYRFFFKKDTGRRNIRKVIQKTVFVIIFLVNIIAVQRFLGIRNTQSGVQIGKLFEPASDDSQVKILAFPELGIQNKLNARSVRVAVHRFLHGPLNKNSLLIQKNGNSPVVLNGRLKAFTRSVYAGCADTMQSACNRLIALIGAELAAGRKVS